MRHVPIFAMTILLGTVAMAAPQPRRQFEILPPEKPVCREQQRCVIDLQTSDGRAPYEWRLVQGTLPAGLSLDRNTGRISGTPTAAGSSTVTIWVRDVTGRTASRKITITIRSLLDVVWQSAPSLSATNLSGSLIVTNYSGNPVMLTVIVVAVNEINKAFALGYQHTELAPGAATPVIPFGMQLPPGHYRVRADAVGEVAPKNIIYRSALEAGPFATP